MIIDLDKTEMTEKIIETIVNGLTDNGKTFRKIAFVGIDRRWRRKFIKIQETGCLTEYFRIMKKPKNG